MRFIIILFLLLFPFIVQSRTSERFSCYLFGFILRSIDEQNDKYRVYLQIKDSVYLDRQSGTNYEEYLIRNKSSIPDEIMDSLVKYCDYKYIFDDPIFHFSKKNIIVDKFGFFDAKCSFISGQNYFSFSRNVPREKKSSKPINIIQVTSIRVYRDRFIVAFQSSKSNHEVHFYFELLRGAPPLITNIILEDPLHG